LISCIVSICHVYLKFPLKIKDSTFYSLIWINIGESKSKDFKYIHLYKVSSCTDCGINHFIKHCVTTYVISAYQHWCCEFESRSQYYAGCQVILYSYIFPIFSRFCYIPKSYIFSNQWVKSWIFNFERKFQINMTNRYYTRYQCLYFYSFKQILWQHWYLV
jgi:hypothetical protein